jgi:uncharacterized SAM-binding protein YcdF (DUF218 family)
MAQPIFLVCYLLFCCSLVLARRNEKGTARIVFLAALGFWAISTPYFVQLVQRKWETQTACIPIDEWKPFDVIVVLGGGSGTRPSGDPQFGGAGDRIGFAARMYHLGLTKKLITTGDVMQLNGAIQGGFEKTDAPSQQTKRMWIELGIPEEAIETIGGENTYSEMVELSQHQGWINGKRCGLVTSAMHMPRARTLSQRAGLELEPIAVDFGGGPTTHPITLSSFLPSAGSAHTLGLILKEWIAMSLGR